MQSPLDMARRLKLTSLRKIAAEVAHLNHVPVPQPLSLSELLTLFANVAKPKVPDIVDIYNFGRIDWKDASAGTFRYATLYHAKIEMNVYGWFRAYDGWTSGFTYVASNQLPYNTDCRAAVIGWNEWGHSETTWVEFSSADNPNPSPPPPSPTPPPQVQHYSAIVFYNCDNTPPPASDKGHLPVVFHLRNVTTNGGWQFWQVAPGYDTSPSGQCGQGTDSVPFTVPGLTAGDTYEWIVTKPDDPECSDSSTDPTDPNHCPILGPGTVTIGGDIKLSLQWPPV
ncbi:MAG TPA: hypothetical protein VL240_10500 [Candidatus Binatia bacterium]|nr:hypothetical protein [Candidatus Binatia bacterium]